MFYERKVIRGQNAVIQRIAKCAGPLMMKVMKQARIDPGPIMHRHATGLPLLPFYNGLE